MRLKVRAERYAPQQRRRFLVTPTSSSEQNSAYGTVALAYGESRRRVQTKRVNRQKQRCRRAFVLHLDGTSTRHDSPGPVNRTDVTIRRRNTRQGRKTMGLEEKKNGGALKEMPFARASICPGSHSSSASRIGSSSTRHAEQMPSASPHWQSCWQCRFSCNSSRHSCQSCRAFSSLTESDARIAALRVLFQCAFTTPDGSVGRRGP